jgi:putative ABC transport system permease protein
MAIVDGASMTLVSGAEPERVQCALVSASLFPLLGVRPVVGRAFLEEEDRPAAMPVVILGNEIWRRRFNSDPQVVGQQVTLSKNSYTIVGVMPDGFKMPSNLLGGRPFDVWMPITPAAYKRNRAQHRFECYGRLKPEATMQSAQEELSAIAARLEATYPDTNKDKGARLASLKELVVGDSRALLWILLGAVSFVLLIACANVANLLLARATTRAKEVAIRSALGASRRQIVGQFLTESLLLALAGGTVGLFVAMWAADALVALQPRGIPRLDEIGIDTRVLGFTLGVSVVTGILFGLAPAIQISKPDVAAAIKESSLSATAGRGSNRLRSALIVCEVALSVVLLVGAGLLIKSLWLLTRVDPGIRTDNRLTLQLSLPQSDYAKDNQAKNFYEQLIERVKATPGVESAAAVNILPLGGGYSCDSFTRDDRPAPPGQEPCAEYRSITPEYFRAMGIPLTRGREFAEGDQSDTAPVAIINEAFVREYFADVNPIGMRITSDTGKHVSREVVGIVGDVKHFGLDKEAKPELYVPYFQDSWPRSMVVVLRTASEPKLVIGAVRNEVSLLDKNLPVINVRTMDELLRRSTAEPRFRALLLALFAAIAIILSALGIYGVISYSVTQRTREIGIRLALGAKRQDIIRMVVRQGMLLTLAGVVIGLGAAFMLTRALSDFLFTVSATDALTFVAVSLLLTGAALGACFAPARRATRVDPMVALRYE